MKKRDMILTILGIIVLFGLAFFVQEEMDSYIRRIVNLCLVYAIIGLSMNLTNGFVGQFSLGQAGFMAIGAYTVGIFTVPVEYRENVFYAVPMNPLIADIELPLWAALILGGACAVCLCYRHAGAAPARRLPCRNDAGLFGNYPHLDYQRAEHY